MRACNADVAKLVDAPDLGSGVEIREGSSPFIRTTSFQAGPVAFGRDQFYRSPRQSPFILV